MTHVFAQTFTLPDGSPISGPEGFGHITIGNVINKAIPFIFAFAGIGLLLMLLMAGFNFLTSAGDPKKLEMGKQRLTYAIVGFLIVFTAYWAVQLAGIIFGVQEIQTTFPR